MGNSFFEHSFVLISFSPNRGIFTLELLKISQKRFHTESVTKIEGQTEIKPISKTNVGGETLCSPSEQ